MVVVVMVIVLGSSGSGSVEGLNFHGVLFINHLMKLESPLTAVWQFVAAEGIGPSGLSNS